MRRAVAAHSSTTVPFTVTVAATVPAGTATIVNTVNSSTGTCSSCTVTTPTVAVLDVVKTLFSVNGAPVGPTATVGPNDVLVYDITVTDRGGSAGSTTLTETVPANTTFTGTGWTCTPHDAAGSTCAEMVMAAANSSTTVPFEVTVAATLPAGTATIVNTVTSSTGICSSCTVTTPTVAVMDTAKTLFSVNGT